MLVCSAFAEARTHVHKSKLAHKLWYIFEPSGLRTRFTSQRTVKKKNHHALPRGACTRDTRHTRPNLHDGDISQTCPCTGKARVVMKELFVVRRATGKRLSNRLPHLSLLALPSPLERRDIQVQTGCTGRRVTNSRFQFMGAQGEYFAGSTYVGKFNYSLKRLMMEDGETRTRNPKAMFCRRRYSGVFDKVLVCWAICW